MSQHAFRIIFCLYESGNYDAGHNQVLHLGSPVRIDSVDAAATLDILKFQQLVYQSIAQLFTGTRIIPADLRLWKLKQPLNIRPLSTLHKRLLGSDLSIIGVDLTEDSFGLLLPDMFNADLPRDHLHMIVQYPPLSSSYNSVTTSLPVTTFSPEFSVPMSTSSSGPSSTSNRTAGCSNTWCRREKTVAALYELSLQDPLIQVRGTPGSGKTTLLQLLFHHIKDRSFPVHFIRSWPRPASYVQYFRGLEINFPHTRKTTYLLIDDAQDTYQSFELWNEFFKDVAGHGTNYRVILFCSYGSPTGRLTASDFPEASDSPPRRRGTALQVWASARVSLWPREDETTIGLSFTREEFDSVVKRREVPVLMHPDLQTMIFFWSGGHAGACMFLLELVSLCMKGADRRGKEITIRDFFDDHPLPTIVDVKCGGGDFGRGVPSDSELITRPGVVRILRKLLKNGIIKVTEPEPDEIPHILVCYTFGWVHAELITVIDNFAITSYVLPSPLHTVWLSWKLRATEDEPRYDTLFGLCIAVISRFRPSQLHVPIHRPGMPYIQNLPEAQWQDEFYRGAFDATHGNVRISPGFASARSAKPVGWIDFFIPSAKWGIEITQDGHQLAEHASSRFEAPGDAYGRWLVAGQMTDYILLDFRTNVPQQPHPNIAGLYHVVFEENLREFVVLDNVLNVVRARTALIETRSG